MINTMNRTSSDYQRIERAIAFLDEHRHEQPSLEALATELGVSPFHLQRLFKRWAGISPKRFLQYLTVEYAKAQLTESASVLDAALATGLSGPSRLHDHFVSLEAVTPGEFKSGGRDLEIRYAMHACAFGEVFLAETDRGVCRLAFAERSALDREVERLGAVWPRARLRHDPKTVGDTISRIFTPEPGSGPLSLFVRGTNFQVAVWRALLEIPQGRLTTYGRLAEAVGRRRGARAVGAAVGANPVAFVIPCHRVIRSAGALGGYRWGLARKRALIAWEAARRSA